MGKVSGANFNPAVSVALGCTQAGFASDRKSAGPRFFSPFFPTSIWLQDSLFFLLKDIFFLKKKKKKKKNPMLVVKGQFVSPMLVLKGIYRFLSLFFSRGS